MNKIIIPVLASVLILGTLGMSYDAFAGDGNNGNNGCENANPNAKACESNPNTEPLIQTVKITVTHADTGQFFEGANCVISFDDGLIVEGLTDVNGEVLLIVPAELDLIRQTACFEVVPIPPGPAGRQCDVSLNGVFTEIEIQIPSGGGGCF